MAAKPMMRWAAERRLDRSAAIWAGVISGAVFLAVEMLLVQFVLGDSMWAPPRMIAAIVMGDGVLPPPATFDAMIVAVAMLLHFALSVVYAVILAMIVSRLGWGPALIAGAAYGLALYAVNFYGMSAIFPWFAMARNWVSIFAHILFGFVAAWAYKGMQKAALARVATPLEGAGRQDRMAAD